MATIDANVDSMGWDEFAAYLSAQGRTRAADTKKQDEDLREYFGEDEFEYLQRLAQAGTTRAASQKAGNVVFLPGIMGSNLITTRNGDEDMIWINLFRLVFGRFARLRLTFENNRWNDAEDYAVSAVTLHKRTYARTLLSLGINWNVKPFPFDWRRDLTDAATGLKAFIENNFQGQPVHLVAHSMGGLVCREMIRQDPKFWDGLRGNNGSGGRLIMLDTPNYGSYAIPQVLTGAETLLRWLERVDLKHNMLELLEIVHSFISCYQMLPALGKIPAGEPALYKKGLGFIPGRRTQFGTRAGVSARLGRRKSDN